MQMFACARWNRSDRFNIVARGSNLAQEFSMTTRTAQLAIALALTSSMVMATAHQSLAGCTQNDGAGCFKKGTWPHTVRKYYNYAPRAKQSHHDPYDDPQIKAIWEEAIGQ